MKEDAVSFYCVYVWGFGHLVIEPVIEKKGVTEEKDIQKEKLMPKHKFNWYLIVIIFSLNRNVKLFIYYKD